MEQGRWKEAREAAERLVGIWPEHAYIAAFAALEQGDRDDAIGWFLHGALTRPRTSPMLLSPRRLGRHEAAWSSGSTAEAIPALHGSDRPR